GLQPDQTTTCHTAKKSATAASLGQSQDQARAPGAIRRSSITWSSTSGSLGDAASAAIWLKGSPRTHGEASEFLGNSATMQPRLLLEPLSDAAREHRQLWRPQAAGPGQVDLDLVGDPARPAGEHEHAVPQQHGLARVVCHEQDGEVLLGPEAHQLLVQEVARDGV